MAKESLQKKVGRVRPPRVHITYDVQVGDTVVRVVGQAEQVVPQGTAVGLTFPASSAVSVG